MARPLKVSREQVLAATRERVRHHGIGVPLPLIAADLSVSVTLLIKRFGSKDQLILQSLWPSGGPMPAAPLFLTDPAAPVAAATGLAELADWFAIVLAEISPALRAVRDHGLMVDDPLEALGLPGADELSRGLAAWVGTLDRRGEVNCADPEIFAASFLGALYFQHVHALLNGADHPQASPLDARQRMIKLFLAAVRLDRRAEEPVSAAMGLCR